MPDISSPPERTEELVERARRVQAWLDGGCSSWLPPTADIRALARAALQSSGYAEMERENARWKGALENAALDLENCARRCGQRGDPGGFELATNDAQDARSALRGDHEQGEG